MMVKVAHSYSGRNMRLLPYLRRPRNRWWDWSQTQGKAYDHTGPSCDPLPPKGLYLLRVSQPPKTVLSTGEQMLHYRSISFAFKA